MAKFGLGKSVPKQGGVAGAHVAPSRGGKTTGGSPNSKSQGLGPGNATNANKHTPGKGGTGTTSAGGPKPFKG